MKRIGVIMLVAGAVIVAVVLGLNSLSDSKPASSNTPFDAISFSGSDSTITPLFDVTTDEWIVEWSHSGGDFNFFVYPKGENVYIMSVWSADSTGSTYSHEDAGRYYIKVLAYSVDNWQITIKPA